MALGILETGAHAGRQGTHSGAAALSLLPAAQRRASRRANAAQLQLRNRLAFDWLADHPSTRKHIRRIADFTSDELAGKWLSKMAAVQLIQHVGAVKEMASQDGAPLGVFCRWRPKSDILFHEVKGTDFCELYRDAQVMRANESRLYDEDITMIRKDITFRIEIHVGTQSRGQVGDRLTRYFGDEKRPPCRDKILYVVCPKLGDEEALLARLVQWCRPAWRMALFTTLARLQRDGAHARVWEEHTEGDGKTNKEMRRITP